MMNSIEHLNRLFLFAHPQSSTPTSRLLSIEEDAVDDQPLSIVVREYSTFFLIDVLSHRASWDDVNMSATADSLKIFACVERAESVSSDQAIHSTHHIGSVTRYIRLPVKINPAAIESKAIDGVLQFRLPKADSFF